MNLPVLFRRRRSLSQGLQLWWKLDEAAGNLRADSVTGAVLAPSGTGTIASVAGLIGNAADLTSGSAQYLTSTDNTLGKNSGSYTIACWVKFKTLDTQAQSIVARWQTSVAQQEYLLDWLGNPTNRFRIITEKAGATGTTSLSANAFGAASTGVWYHVVAWYDAVVGQIGIAVNTVVNTTAQPGGQNTGTAQLVVGRQYAAEYLSGQVDLLGIWNRVLTAPEISYLYHLGAGIDFPFTS